MRRLGAKAHTAGAAAALLIFASRSAIALPVVTICDDDGANCVQVQDATPQPDLDDPVTRADAWALDQVEDHAEGEFIDQILEWVVGEEAAEWISPIIDVFESEETAPPSMDEIDPNNPPEPFTQDQSDNPSTDEAEEEDLDDGTSDTPEPDSDLPPLIIEPVDPVPDPTPLASNDDDDDDDSVFDD